RHPRWSAVRASSPSCPSGSPERSGVSIPYPRSHAVGPGRARGPVLVGRGTRPAGESSYSPLGPCVRERSLSMTHFLLAFFLLTVFGALLGIAIREGIRSVWRDKIASVAVSCLWAAAAIGALILPAPAWLLGALALSLAGALLGRYAY